MHDEVNIILWGFNPTARLYIIIGVKFQRFRSIWVHLYIAFHFLWALALTFDDPGAAGSPAGTDAEVVDGKGFWVLPGEDGCSLSLAASHDDSVAPAHPEGPKLISVEYSAGGHFHLVGFLAVAPDDALGVAPASEEYLKY